MPTSVQEAQARCTNGLSFGVSNEEYSYSLVGDDAMAWSQLGGLKVFRPEIWPHALDIIDILPVTGFPSKRDSVTFTDAKYLADHLKSTSGKVRTRFISIHQKNSWASLELSRSMLECIVRTHDIMPEFLSTVRCFQDKTCNVEQAFAGNLWKRCVRERKELAFVLKYPEHNGRSDGADPWSMRQTGVYQSYDRMTKTSLWILLNPKPKSMADARLRHLLEAPTGNADQTQIQPPIVGLIVLSTYFANWRTYMAYYEKEELRMSSIVISTTISEKLQLSHSTLSSLRRLESRLLLMQQLLRSSMQSIHMLEAFNDSFRDSDIGSDEVHNATQEILKNYATIAESYIQNASFLFQKTRATAQLLSDTLNLKHQQNAHDLSENTLALTNATVQDSATIRIITFVTMLYLPASFIATLFGMQLFTISSTGDLMVASSQLWIFFALATPFTAATFGYWKWMDRRMRLKAGTLKLETDSISEV